MPRSVCLSRRRGASAARQTPAWLVGALLALTACGAATSPPDAQLRPRDAAPRDEAPDESSGDDGSVDDAPVPDATVAADAFDPFADDARSDVPTSESACPPGETQVVRATGTRECARICADDAECAGELCEPVTDAPFRVCTNNPCGRSSYPVHMGGRDVCTPLCATQADCARGVCTRLLDAPRSVCIVSASPDAGPPVLCDPGETVCNGVCVSLALDPEHCGACNRGCDFGRTCAAGRCVAPVDPCMGVPENGRCSGPDLAERCVQSTGDGARTVQSESCEAGFQCSVVAGEAACRRVAECDEGATQCLDANTLRRCQGGRWQSTPCTGGCTGGSMGANCHVSGIALREIVGNLTYEYRTPREDRRDWGAIQTAPAPSLDLYVYRGNQILYFSFVNRGEETNNGNFRAQIPVTPTADDRIVFVAATSPTSSSPMQYVLADPMLAAGTHPTSTKPTSPRVWTWQARVQTLPANNRLVITEGSHSGAVHAFASLVRTYEFARRTYGRYGRTLVTWLGYGVEWSCGSCFARSPANALGQSFATQIWLSDADRDQRHWASAVTTHEVGHWIMDSYGVSPGEGGTHYVGTPTYPGQAWSEGWATFVSSEQRGDAIYVDKARGAMFWFDADARRYGSGRAWQRPVATQPLTQRHDENDVSAMLLDLAGADATPLYRALASPRMAGPTFARGYTRHRWTTTSPGVFTNVTNLGTSAPFFADLLDALGCSGFTATRIDDVTEPLVHYPFPSTRLLCR